MRRGTLLKKLSLLVLFSIVALLYCQIISAQTTFTNVAREAGLWEVKRFFSMAPVWGDYDNDGDLDIYVTHGDWVGWRMEGDVFFRNNDDGTFTDVTEEAGLDENTGDNDHAGFLDYDNDGDLDLYVYNSTDIDDRIALYQNNGDGTFDDVTQEAGTSLEPGLYWSATFSDYNNDGHLDIYVTRMWNPNVFFESNGDGTFTDQTDKAGIGDSSSCVNVASGDYDNDGDMDIYLANGTGGGESQPIVLYRNNGDGTFMDVAEEAGVDGKRMGRSVAFLDYDNDGNLDIYAAGVRGTPIRLYHNNGDGTFTDATKEAGVLIGGNNERLTVGDYDNDGYMDIFLMSWGQMAKLYHNNGDGTFTNVTGESGIQVSGKAGGCAFADYDNDGDLDLYAASIGGGDALYRNEGNDNHWLHIKAVGSIGEIPINIKRTNKDGVGARVIVQAGELSMVREINPGCSRGYNPLIAYFGLGQNAVADSVEIRWPSGQLTNLINVPADQMIAVTEGKEGYEKIDVEPVKHIAVEPQGKFVTTWAKIKRNKLYQNYPNPFNPETWISYQLAKSADVTIHIYDQLGQSVRTLKLGHKKEGGYLERAQSAYWDGKNDAGESVASGIYFYRLEAGGFSQTHKMTLLK